MRPVPLGRVSGGGRPQARRAPLKSPHQRSFGPLRHRCRSTPHPPPASCPGRLPHRDRSTTLSLHPPPATGQVRQAPRRLQLRQGLRRRRVHAHVHQMQGGHRSGEGRRGVGQGHLQALQGRHGAKRQASQVCQGHGGLMPHHHCPATPSRSSHGGPCSHHSNHIRTSGSGGSIGLTGALAAPSRLICSHTSPKPCLRFSRGSSSGGGKRLVPLAPPAAGTQGLFVTATCGILS
jgi:hypothetical protein